VPSTQSLSNRSLASDPPRQFCDQMSLISSDNIVQKGVRRDAAKPNGGSQSVASLQALTLDWHAGAIGAVLSVNFGRQGRREILPRRLPLRGSATFDCSCKSSPPRRRTEGGLRALLVPSAFQGSAGGRSRPRRHWASRSSGIAAQAASGPFLLICFFADLDIEILRSVCGDPPHQRSPATAIEPAGQDLGPPLAPGN
jgi:hypothetical protein